MAGSGGSSVWTSATTSSGRDRHLLTTSVVTASTVAGSGSEYIVFGSTTLASSKIAE